MTGVTAAVLLSATAAAMGPILGPGPAKSRLEGALPALLAIVAAAALARVATALASYSEKRITPKLITEADTALVNAVCRVEASAYAVTGFADRQKAAEMGVARNQAMVADAQRLLSALLRILTASGVLSILHPALLPLLALAALPAGVGAVLSARVDYEVHYANMSDHNVRSMMRWWATGSNFADEVRANSMADYLTFWYRALSRRIDLRTLSAAPRTLRTALKASAVGGVFLLITWSALAWLAISGHIEMAIAATAVVAVQTALAALSQLVNSGAAVFHTSLYLNDMREFLELADSLAVRRGKATASLPLDTISLSNATYKYPGSTRPAVDCISLNLHRGEILAIVGANGSGKSTLVRLLSGIHVPQQGHATWNSTDIRTLDANSIWKNTGLVPQMFAQWPLAVRENVTLGQPRSQDDTQTWNALDAVGMRDAIGRLPHGIDTLLAKELYGGTELSGGQWQRLACSRALYRQPDLLILDEPTSQMDPRGEHEIFEQIKANASHRITVIVTHRIQNTKIADRIICMEDGRITEQGTYSSLAAADGLFAELLALSEDR
ncbi:ATP-binding cassette domain-containing protein [Streptomyces albidoflavus]|nr:ATP-binding cassette domain-containing protein [Streptomyces sp. WAC00276]MCK2141652.1 ATP-binding cassette domain-containing protein [Streptomyces sp. WAC00276]